MYWVLRFCCPLLAKCTTKILQTFSSCSYSSRMGVISSVRKHSVSDGACATQQSERVSLISCIPETWRHCSLSQPRNVLSPERCLLTERQLHEQQLAVTACTAQSMQVCPKTRKGQREDSPNKLLSRRRSRALAEGRFDLGCSSVGSTPMLDEVIVSCPSKAR